ncbi:MAG: alpha/beta hydrolase family protein [Solirubrobacteraceae bacterium]
MLAFQDDEFQFAFERALGASYRQGADVGEVLATAGRITDGDADSWLHEWTATAGTVWVAAVRARRSGRRVSALAHFRRAATYYATALYLISHSSEPGRRLDIWRRQRACWEQILDLSPVPGERVAVAYEHTALPAFFFPAAGPAGGGRPLVVVNNGSFQATSETWAQAGAAAAERGYHWLTFDGPGQQAMLLEQRIFFRPDWERVLTPVLDAVLARADVDPDRVAVIGLGQGGYWVARALAFEHRFAAAVVDPGIVDVATAWIDRLPSAMREQLNDRRQSAFDREMHIAELFWPARTQLLRFHGEPYGHNGGSAFRLFLTIAAYRLGYEVDQIDTPLLITESEGEQLWPGQSRQLYDRLNGPKEIVTFTAHEGAGGHCEPLAQALREARIFDWLEEHLG